MRPAVLISFALLNSIVARDTAAQDAAAGQSPPVGLNAPVGQNPPVVAQEQLPIAEAQIVVGFELPQIEQELVLGTVISKPMGLRVAAAADVEIEAMKNACGLDEKQVRMLQIAAKGVRSRLKNGAGGQPVPRRIMAGRAMNVTLNSSQGVTRQQLVTSSLWQRTVERVLSKEQQELWKKAPKPTTQNLTRLGGLRGFRPNVDLRLNDAVEIAVIRELVEQARIDIAK